MKNIQMLAGCILLLGMAGVVNAETYTKPAAITVVGVSGEARYSTDGKVWHPIVVGKILRQGAVLETASGSTVDLVMSGTPVAVPESSSAPQSLDMLSVAPDPNVRGYAAYKPMSEQNVVHMQGNTMLAVDQLSVVNTGADTVGNTELDLRSGNIFVNVKKLSASSQYIVKLPNGVAGIRGSTCSFGANDDVECFRGEVVLVIMGPHGIIKKTIQGGFKYDPATDTVFDMSPSMRKALREFNISARTLIAQVVHVNDTTYVYISPTQGRKPNPPGDDNSPPENNPPPEEP
jgi:hypothetical protein